MSIAMTPIDKAISEYKLLSSRVKDLEAQKAILKAAIEAEMGTEIKYIGPRGSAVKVSFMQHRTDFTKAKEMLDADVYYEIIAESPVDTLRIS